MQEWASHPHLTLGWEEIVTRKKKRLFRAQRLPLGWQLNFSADGCPYFENTLQNYCTRYDPRSIVISKDWARLWTDRGTPLFRNLLSKEEVENISGVFDSPRRAATEAPSTSGILRFPTSIIDSEVYEEYKHQGLPSATTIRLLKYAGREVNGMPRFSIEVFETEEVPRYVALSYTWGNPKLSSEKGNETYHVKRKWPILCNGKIALVTKNLHDFIQQTGPEYLIPKDVIAGGIPLHNAAHRGDDIGVSNGIEIGMSINSFDILGRTPLYLAAQAGHESTVNLLLSQGADPNLDDEKGRTPLFMATVISNESIVRRLLLVGADPERRTSKSAPAPEFTALEFAIRRDDLKIVKALLEGKASLGTRRPTGVTALHSAACCKNAEMIRLLLTHGAQIEAEAYSADGLSSGTALFAAAQYKSLECICVLLDHGAYVNARNCYGRTALHSVAEDDVHESTQIASFLIERGASVKIKSINTGWTVLHCAAAYGTVELIDVILDAGADIEAVENLCGRTALHIACEFTKLDNMRCLLKYGANVQARTQLDGRTSLHMSVGRAVPEAVRLLISEGAVVNMKDDEMNTPLHQAVGALMAPDKKLFQDAEYNKEQESQRAIVASILLENGAEVNALNKFGYSPLHHAAGNRKVEMVTVLLDNGADPELRTPLGSTPLMWATSYNDVEVVQALLDRGAGLETSSETDWPLLSAVQNDNMAVAKLLLHLGASLTTLDRDGDTVLHIAALAGHARMVSLLLDYDSPLQTTNLKGWVPLDYAVDRGHVESVQVLIGHGAKLTQTNLEGKLNGLLDPKLSDDMDEEDQKANKDEVHDVDYTFDEQTSKIQEHIQGRDDAAQHTSLFDKQGAEPLPELSWDSINHQSQTISIPYIWIDAICIDQENDKERLAQIKIMSQIYQKASIVHVWLGLEDVNTKLSSQAVQKLVKFHTNKKANNYDPDLVMWYHMRKGGYIPKEVYVPVDDEVIGFPTANHQWTISLDELDSFQSLIHRQWFERIWITQEFSRARYVHMSCGKQTIPWGDFYRALMILMPARAFFAKGPQIWKRISEGTAAFICAELHARFHPGDDYALATMATITPWSHTSRLSLSALLLLTWNFKASDPRDKVFALLGLVTGQEESTQSMEADYSRSFEDIYIEVAKTLLDGFGEIDDSTDFIVRVTKDDIPSLEPLEALTFAGHGKYFSKDGLPSWVPNFGNPTNGPRLWYPKYEPYADISTKWSFPSRGVLRIRGQFCETIVGIEVVHKEQPLESVHRFPVWLNLLTMDDHPQIDWNEDEYGPIVRLRHALTFVRKTDTAGEFSASRTQKAFTAFLLFCIQKRLLLEASGETKVNWLDWKSRLKMLYPYDVESVPSLEEIEEKLEDAEVRVKVEGTSLQDVYEEVRPFLDPLIHFSARYRLFRADDGYIGLMPKGTLPLDRLCVFGGANTVFVLRKVESADSRWRLIGEAFMQDITLRGEEQDIDLE